jgi:hypothetical protein
MHNTISLTFYKLVNEPSSILKELSWFCFDYKSDIGSMTKIQSIGLGVWQSTSLASTGSGFNLQYHKKKSMHLNAQM